MKHRIREVPHVQHSTNGQSATTQADEALRRATAPPDATRDVYQQLAARAGRQLLESLDALPEFKPRPGITLGRLSISITVTDSGLDLGSVDLDSINVDDLADLTARRAEGLRAKHATPAPAPVPAGRPVLRLVGGGQ